MSPSIVIAYLMKTNGWSLTASFEFVQTRRKKIAPNARYLQQLIALDKSLFGTTPFSEEPLPFGFIRDLKQVKRS